MKPNPESKLPTVKPETTALPLGTLGQGSFLIALLALLSTLNAHLSTCFAAPLGTAFTYQGRLGDGGSGANGSYEFRFELFDTPILGDPIGVALTNVVTVEDGAFTTALDFGAEAFNGEARWLRIAVRTNGSTGAFTSLTPRQPLLPAPHALVAGAAKVVPASGIVGTVAAARIDSAMARDNEILPTVLANDGPGSGLDADTVDGLHAADLVGAAHDHYGASWTGSASKGFSVQTSSSMANGGAALYGKQGIGSGSPQDRTAGVWGDSSDGYGVVATTGSTNYASLLVVASATNGPTCGVYSETLSPNGAAVVANGLNGGASIAAGGTGLIRSTADSYVFVSPTSLIKEDSNDSTHWIFRAGGAARIWGGTNTGYKNVLFPITIPAQLYGQPVTVESATIYYQCYQAANGYIAGTSFHKQTSAITSDGLANDGTSRTSTSAASYTLTFSSGNRLSRNEGALCCLLTLYFANDTSFVQIGGIRLQFSHH